MPEFSLEFALVCLYRTPCRSDIHPFLDKFEILIHELCNKYRVRQNGWSSLEEVVGECVLVVIGRRPHFSCYYGLDRRTLRTYYAVVILKQQICDRNIKSSRRRFIIPWNNPVLDANTVQMWIMGLKKVVARDADTEKTPENVQQVRWAVERWSSRSVRNYAIALRCRLLCEVGFKVTIKVSSLQLRASFGSNRMGLKRTLLKIF